MARSIWSGSVSFGLVNIRVKDRERVAIGKIVMRDKQYLAVSAREKEPAAPKKSAEVVDLVEALRASLETPRGGAARRSGSAPGMRARSARKATKRSAPRRRTKRSA